MRGVKKIVVQFDFKELVDEITELCHQAQFYKYRPETYIEVALGHALLDDEDVFTAYSKGMLRVAKAHMLQVLEDNQLATSMIERVVWIEDGLCCLVLIPYHWYRTRLDVSDGNT